MQTTLVPVIIYVRDEKGVVNAISEVVLSEDRALKGAVVLGSFLAEPPYALSYDAVAHGVSK